MARFDKRLQQAEKRIRKLMYSVEDDAIKRELKKILDDVLAGHYEAQEEVKQTLKNLGGKYGFLPSGVTDYLDDDFDDDEDLN